MTTLAAFLIYSGLILLWVAGLAAIAEYLDRRDER